MLLQCTSNYSTIPTMGFVITKTLASCTQKMARTTLVRGLCKSLDDDGTIHGMSAILFVKVAVRSDPFWNTEILRTHFRIPALKKNSSSSRSD